jgi:hypothetical protein
MKIRSIYLIIGLINRSGDDSVKTRGTTGMSLNYILVDCLFNFWPLF